jgi:hypothetical protein
MFIQPVGARRANKGELGGCCKVTASGLLSFILFSGWTTVLWILLIGKMVLGDDGVQDYFRHFTNWSWTLSALYFLIDVIAYVLPRRWRLRVRYFLITYCFWWVSGTAWLVFWIVFVILNDNPLLLTNISDSGGFSLGLVYCMDRIFHVLPPLVLWLYALFRRTYFYAALFHRYRQVQRWPVSGKIAWIMYVFGSTIAPLPLLFVYWFVFDIGQVYGLHAPIALLASLGAGVLLVSNLAPLTLLYEYSGQSRSNQELAMRLLSEL